MMLNHQLKHLFNIRNLTFCQWQTLRTLTSLPSKPGRAIGNGKTVAANPVSNPKGFHPKLLLFPSRVRFQNLRFASTETRFPYKEDLFFKYVESLQTEYEDAMKGVNTSQSSRQMVLREILTLYKEYQQTTKDKKELQDLLAEGSSDKDLLNMMESEQKELDAKLEDLKLQLEDWLLPNESIDENDIIVEVSAGVGGDEAMLFAKEIFEMYLRYAQYKGWACEILEEDTVDMGGLRSASVSISGSEVYKLMKYESGVHRVQRVPKTEVKGRVHTSTITVAIMPQPTDIDIVIEKSDLKIESFKSSGSGGQSVNTTNSAVRITHLPTNTSVECREERSLHTNTLRAMKNIQSRLFNAEYEKQLAATQQQRKVQVGTAGRSEKIRTYNYPQNRITEHRIHHSVFDIGVFMSGGDMLDEMIHTVLRYSQQEVLMEKLEEFEREQTKLRKSEKSSS